MMMRSVCVLMIVMALDPLLTGDGLNRPRPILAALKLFVKTWDDAHAVPSPSGALA